MDETVMAEKVISIETIPANTTIQITNAPAAPMSLQQTVRNAAELGWLIAELLGRCFVLQETPPPHLNWDGSQLEALQGLSTPREKLRAIAQHIHYLANTLGVGSLSSGDDDDGQPPAIALIKADITLLCTGPFNTSPEETFEAVRGRINQRLFFWDLKINDALQNKPAVVQKAYLVGYGLGAARWYYGLPGIQLDKGLKEKVLQYLPVLGPHLSQFASEGLVGTIEPWWQALSQPAATAPMPISDNQQVEGLAPPELQRQGHIWYSLVTGERDALSYVDPTIRNRPYIWQVLDVIWPFFLIAVIILLLVIALAIFIIISYHNQIVTAITAAAGFLTTFGIIQALQNNAGGILQNAVSTTTATIKGTYLDQIWNANRQKAVNKAVYVPPPVIGKAPPHGKDAPAVNK
jgi:hypothetical protein